jgi:predicted DNA-binding protein (MmcQ/YjbR family)
MLKMMKTLFRGSSDKLQLDQLLHVHKLPRFDGYDIESFRKGCSSLENISVGLERTLHFINLKCDPERAIELSAQYEAVQPGWHVSKVM